MNMAVGILPLYLRQPTQTCSDYEYADTFLAPEFARLSERTKHSRL